MDKYIETELKKYSPTEAAINSMKDEFMPLKVTSNDDKLGYSICVKAHQEVKKLRISVEKKRKELNQSSLEFTRAINGEAKRLTLAITEVEDHLDAQRKIVEDEKKRLVEEARLKQEAEALAKLQEEQRIRDEEAARLETQRQEQAEIALKQREAQDKIDADKAEIQAQKDKIDNDWKEAEQQKLRAKQLREAKEKAKQKAIVDERARAEREAKAKADKQEADRIEAVRLEDLKPDVIKLRNLATALRAYELPDVVYGESVQVIEDVRRDLNGIAVKLEVYCDAGHQVNA